MKQVWLLLLILSGSPNLTAVVLGHQAYQFKFRDFILHGVVISKEIFYYSSGRDVQKLHPLLRFALVCSAICMCKCRQLELKRPCVMVNAG